MRLRTVEPYERQIVATILAGLSSLPEVAWCARMNTGAAQGDRFVRFGFVGLADIIGQMVDGRMLAIECKRPGERATEPQQLFLHWVHQAGGLAGVARSWEEVQAILSGVPPTLDPSLVLAGPRPTIKCLSKPKAAELNLKAVAIRAEAQRRSSHRL